MGLHWENARCICQQKWNKIILCYPPLYSSHSYSDGRRRPAPPTTAVVTAPTGEPRDHTTPARAAQWEQVPRSCFEHTVLRQSTPNGRCASDESVTRAYISFCAVSCAVVYFVTVSLRTNRLRLWCKHVGFIITNKHGHVHRDAHRGRTCSRSTMNACSFCITMTPPVSVVNIVILISLIG